MSESQENPAKILVLSFEYPPRAGAGTHVHELVNGLARAGKRVAILAITAGEGRTYTQEGVDVHLVAPSPATCSAVAKLTPARGVLAINEDLIDYGQALLAGERKRPDVIHCHDWYTYRAARALGKRFGIPVVGTAHSTSEPIVRWWGDLPDDEILKQESSLYHTADGLITVSESMKRIISQTHGVAAGKITVAHNGFDWRVFADSGLPPSQKRKLRLTAAAPDEQVVIYAGRLTPQKGVPALIESAARALRRRERVRYLIAGEADSLYSSRMIEEAVKGCGESGQRIKLLGRIDRRQLALLYQVADVAVIPSIYEPFGYAAVEAMAAGVAVVASRVGGLAEIIREGEEGLLVSVREEESGQRRVDVDELAAAQLRLLEDEELRMRLGAAGQRRVMEEFNAEKMARRTLQVYAGTKNAMVNPSH